MRQSFISLIGDRPLSYLCNSFTIIPFSKPAATIYVFAIYILVHYLLHHSPVTLCLLPGAIAMATYGLYGLYAFVAIGYFNGSICLWVNVPTYRSQIQRISRCQYLGQLLFPASFIFCSQQSTPAPAPLKSDKKLTVSQKSHIMAQSLQSLIIGSSNVRRFWGSVPTIITRTSLNSPCTKFTTFSSSFTQLEKSMSFVIIEVLPNFICDSASTATDDHGRLAAISGMLSEFIDIISSFAEPNPSVIMY